MDEGRMSFCDFDLGPRMRDEEQAERLSFWTRTREHLATLPAGYSITPGELQRAIRCSWNLACSLLEELEREGTLRLGTTGRGYQAAQPTTAPTRGYALPLSLKEHGALLRALDGLLGSTPMSAAYEVNRLPADLTLLRAVRARLKRPA